MNVNIRKATEKDSGQMLSLIHELAVFEKEPDAVQITEKDLKKYGFGKNSLFKTFIAEEEGETLGMALFYDRFSTWVGKSLHLEDLIVREQHRKKGVGKALFTKFFEYAYENGYNRAEWAVLDWNTPAVNFYKDAGATVYDDWQICQIDRSGIEKYLSR
ncbi:MAG: GNAT family N-acetyltransferase [Flavobacteriales bacterium]|nr:MAG: GNAT family N-acetyltransferase [Flavobacteriales bacterium]PIE49738.1 MAG: GNAT family N-acetyltransferase [Flavobacteriales bacterium]